MKFAPLFHLVLVITAAPLAQAGIPIKSGDKVAFLGDSITEEGKDSPSGYVNLVSSALAANGVKIEVIGAGISGHKSDQMLERLERDVLSKKPQWMTLSCGVNDVWHGEKGVLLDDYKKNITTITDQAQAAGIKVVLLTSTMIDEDQANPNNQKLIPYNEFLRTLAKEKNYLLADLNTEMQEAVAKANTPGKNALTSDGVHMAFPGNTMMATGILKSLGLDAKELTKAQDAWLDLPDTSSLNFEAKFSLREIQHLEKAAAARGTTAQKLLDEEFQKIIQSLKK
jgi:lysophospholipase L1-like esterase